VRIHWAGSRPSSALHVAHWRQDLGTGLIKRSCHDWLSRSSKWPGARTCQSTCAHARSCSAETYGIRVLEIRRNASLPTPPQTWLARQGRAIRPKHHVRDKEDQHGRTSDEQHSIPIHRKPPSSNPQLPSANVRSTSPHETIHTLKSRSRRSEGWSIPTV